MHAAAALVRWQNNERNDMRRRLRKMDVESGFKDEDEDFEEDDDEEDDDNENTAMVEYRGGPSASLDSQIGGSTTMGGSVA